MNAIVSAIVAACVILLIYALLTRSSRGTTSSALHEEVPHRLEDEARRLADEPLLSSADGDSWLIQQPEAEAKPNENVTPSPTNAASRSRCPACGAIITANDESCPSCEITFVADGSQEWTLGNVGPADGICLPLTEIRE